MDLSEAAIRELGRLSGVGLAFEQLDDALDEICRIAAAALEPADGASLTSFSEQGPRAVAASNEWARSLDEVQHAEREGPCIDAGRTGVVFRVRDTSEEPRWPSYMPRAVELGARSVLSLPLTTEAKTVGALNVYAREVDAFDADDVSVGEVIAAHASLASQVAAALFHHQAVADQLRSAMASRAVIEQAKGIVMATRRCGPDDAFTTLVEQSQHENRKLREVAEELVARYGEGR